MKLHIGITHIHLTGNSEEFGEIIGLPDGSTREVKKSLTESAESSGLTVIPDRHTWTVRGTWREFSDFIGLPGTANLNEFSMAFKRLHPEVEITFSRP